MCGHVCVRVVASESCKIFLVLLHSWNVPWLFLEDKMETNETANYFIFAPNLNVLFLPSTLDRSVRTVAARRLVALLLPRQEGLGSNLNGRLPWGENVGNDTNAGASKVFISRQIEFLIFIQEHVLSFWQHYFFVLRSGVVMLSIRSLPCMSKSPPHTCKFTLFVLLICLSALRYTVAPVL